MLARAAISTLIAVTLVAGGIGVTPAEASAFKVAPVRVSLDGTSRLSTLRLTNEGDEPVGVQITAWRWSQVDGEDKLEPSDEIIVNPVITQLPPHATQLLRIAVTRPLGGALEQSFRLMIEELPQRGPSSGQVRALLRLSLPIFVKPAAPRIVLAPQLAAPDRLTLSNQGSVHVQVHSATLLRGTTPVARIEQPLYVLPGAARTISLQPIAGTARLQRGEPLTLVAATDQGEMRAALAWPPAP